MAQINVLVALLNGHAEPFTLLPSSLLQDLKTAAQRAFGQNCLKLITAKNRVLVDFEQTLKEAEIEDGERLTALVLQPQLAATRSAFVRWCHGDSTLVTWGRKDYGGDSSAILNEVKGVQQIQATDSAFAAILEDGSVVTWGHKDHGGDSSAVQDKLKGVQQIVATQFAFAAILADRSVVSWGHAQRGGNSSAVRDQLMGVQQIQAVHNAFAGILADGSVVTWGDADWGVAVRDQLRVCSRLWPHIMLLLRFWQMDPSWPGVTQTEAVTVPQFEISSGVCWRFMPISLHLLQSCQMEPLFRGVIHALAATVRQFKISSKMCSRFRPVGGPSSRLLHLDVLGAPGPCADKSTGCEGEENLQGILWPPASRRARRSRALCWQ